MSLAVNAVVAGLAVFVIVAGSIWYLTVDRQRDRIQVTDVRNAWVGRAGDNERIEVEVTFENRYGVEATLLGWRYELQVHNTRIAYAESTETLVIRPNSDAQSTLSLDVPTDFVGAWVRGHMTSDESTEARFHGEAVFDVSHRNTTVNFGPRVEWKTNLRASLEEIENCPQRAPDPCVLRAEARWETQGEATVLRLAVELRNGGPDPLVVGPRSAELVWGATPVGRADAHGDVVIAPGDSAPVEFRVYLVHELLKDWWSGHVERCESSPTSLRIALSYRIEPEEEPTPTPTTSSRPTTTSSKPTTSTSPSPSTSTPSSSTPTTSSATPPDTSDTDAPGGPVYGNSVIQLLSGLIFEPAVLLQPAGGETGDVTWEFAGPVLRTELVCAKE